MSMGSYRPTRREFSRTAASSLLAAAGAGKLSAQERGSRAEIVVDPTPQHELSPYLYMQFMEPLGVTDGSVEAAWDHLRDDWRTDVVEVTQQLGPTMVRWGGIFTDFYRWQEGVGPRHERPTMINLQWGGLESNQIGTTEFVDFCHRVSAEPLMCVNFESDGRQRFKTAKGQQRWANAQEAADWVAYANDPDNAQRRSHGQAQPLDIRFWQLGNETSYDREGFDLETTAKKSVEFATAMRRADPSIQIIGWGDSGWAGRMLEVAGEHVQMLAFHQMFNPDSRRRPVLAGEKYREDPDATWHQLMQAWTVNDRKIREVRDSLGGQEFPLAMTECHFAIPGRDRCDVLSTWAAGVAYGRILNNHQRHGDLLKIATAADFCGTRWQVNAVMIPVPRFNGPAYLMPVARVMQLYRHHIGQQAVQVDNAPEGLDVVASRNADKLFLHVVNTLRTRSVEAEIRAPGVEFNDGTAFEIADEPLVELSYLNSDNAMVTRKKPIRLAEAWSFPAASVTAIEIPIETPT